MLHQLKEAFRNSKFVLGFVIFVLLLVVSLLYPVFSPFEPLEYVATGFYPPGTYISAADTAKATSTKLSIDTSGSSAIGVLSDENIADMIAWLEEYGGVAPGTLSADEPEALLEAWNANYDENHPQEGMLTADKKAMARIDRSIATANQPVILATEEEDGTLTESKVITNDQFVRTADVGNKITLPLGTDNFGADVATKLTSSILVSMRIGFIAGLIATLIGMTFGLLSGFVGGIVDNFLTFLTNIFTVIPSFVILILIANALSNEARGPETVAVIIGLTAWPWTSRGVRAQVISLRNRDHVNLSKLSGHSLFRIILQDILPYVASYVVMAMILQISSGILSEAQLSMLGLGPSTATTTTLGIMMNWAQQFSAVQSGKWWAFIPVFLSITLITFSLNLMNTGLDQVFNPQLRD